MELPYKTLFTGHLVQNTSAVVGRYQNVGGLQPLQPGVLIPRPHGSLSKQKAGGYSLRETLGWDLEVYRSLQASDCF
jgi:hypothetical protein